MDMKAFPLLIAMMGLALIIVGGVLYFLTDRIADRGYLLLPLPPIAVASYVYVSHWLASNDPSQLRGAELLGKFGQVLVQTVVGGVCFVAITLLMLAGLLAWHSVSGSR